MRTNSSRWASIFSDLNSKCGTQWWIYNDEVRESLTTSLRESELKGECTKMGVVNKIFSFSRTGWPTSYQNCFGQTNIQIQILDKGVNLNGDEGWVQNQSDQLILTPRWRSEVFNGLYSANLLWVNRKRCVWCQSRTSTISLGVGEGIWFIIYGSFLRKRKVNSNQKILFHPINIRKLYKISSFFFHFNKEIERMHSLA